MNIVVKVLQVPNRAKMNVDYKPCYRGAPLYTKIVGPDMSIGKAVRRIQSTTLTTDNFFPTITSNDPPPIYNDSGFLVTVCLHQQGLCKGCFRCRWVNDKGEAIKLYQSITLDLLETETETEA